jgi:AcrR family transcriptional regulator
MTTRRPPNRTRRRSLYHHFRGKAELFEAVVEDEARRITATARTAMQAHHAPRAAANAALVAFLDSASEPGVQRILFQDAPSTLGWARTREIDRHYGLALVRETLERLAAAGEIEVAEPTTRAHLVLAALIEAALLRNEHVDTPGARDRVEQELRTTLRAMTGTPPRPGSGTSS